MKDWEEWERRMESGGVVLRGGCSAAGRAVRRAELTWS